VVNLYGDFDVKNKKRDTNTSFFLSSLKKLGMPEYVERFAQNDIDTTVLPDLTDQHLKDLGVSLGHRLKMLRAIRDLGNASVAVRPSQLGKTASSGAS
jgi:SAM domain (Sterile alpha motif)